MKQLTDKQKKIGAIVVVILAIIHFGPGYLRMFIPAQGHAVDAKPSPAHVAPPAVTTPPPTPEAMAMAKYGGVWEGDTLMPDANRCTVRLEIRLSDDMPKKLKGYSTVRCMPLQPLGRGNLTQAGVKRSVAEAASPASAVMTGTPQDSGITFAVDQSISSSADNCSITSFRIIDFGQGAVAADWQEGTCPARHMLLRKGRG